MMEIIKIRLRLTPQRSQHNLKSLKRCLLNGKPVWQTLILSRTPLLIKMPLSNYPLSNNSRLEQIPGLNSRGLPHCLRQLDFQMMRRSPTLNDLLKCKLFPIYMTKQLYIFIFSLSSVKCFCLYAMNRYLFSAIKRLHSSEEMNVFAKIQRHQKCIISNTIKDCDLFRCKMHLSMST